MKIKKYIFIITLLVFSCKTYDNSYKKCMNERMALKGSKFYEPLKKFETELINKGLLKGKSKFEYYNAFKSMYDKNDSIKWQSFYNSIKDKKYSKYINENQYEFFTICSQIDIDKYLHNNKLKSYDIQKFYFHNLIFKPIDDKETMSNIILFTNFNEEIERLNVTYLLFLQLQKKYDKEYSSIKQLHIN